MGVETGGCPHTAIREDASMNLAAIEDMDRKFRHAEFCFVESGGDNLAATFSPELADLTIYVIDVAEGEKIPRKGGPGITRSDLLVKEPLVVVLPSDHRLASLKAISPADLVGETFVTVAHTAPVLRGVIDDNYLKRSGVHITPAHEIDHVVMGMTVIASTRGVGLLPAYAQDFLNRSVTSRPLKGKAPTVDLVLGYKKSNKSPILKLLLSRLDELVSRVSKTERSVKAEPRTENVMPGIKDTGDVTPAERHA